MRRMAALSLVVLSRNAAFCGLSCSGTLHRVPLLRSRSATWDVKALSGDISDVKFAVGRIEGYLRWEQ